MIYDKKKSNKGFTLVELIVVLVILAILAAILVPALLGYIDRAKESQNILKAKNMLQATQGVLAEYYAKGKDPKDNRKDDYDITTPFAKKVRTLADDNPYLTIIGIGDSRDGDITKHDKHTVYFVAYWETKDKEPVFFNGSEWSMDYPWPEGKSGFDNNYFMVNGEKKCLTFVFVANNTKGQGNLWSYLQKTVSANGRGFAPNNSTTKTGK